MKPRRPSRDTIASAPTNTLLQTFRRARRASRTRLPSALLRRWDASSLKRHVYGQDSHPRPGRLDRVDLPGGELLMHGAGQSNSGDTLRVRGWAAFSDDIPARVEVLVDGTVVGRARLGIPLPGLERLPVTDGIACGFEFVLDLTRLPTPAAEVSITATATSCAGSSIELGPNVVSITRHAFAANPIPGVSQQPGVHRTYTGGRHPGRLLVFTHHLGLGGAQLYLHELLTRLVRDHGHSATVVAPVDGALRARLQRLGVDVQLTAPIPLDDPIRYCEAVERYVEWASATAWDAVLVNTVGAFAGIDAAARLGIPSIWAVHESFDLPVYWAEASPDVPPHPHVMAHVARLLGAANLVVFEADATRKQYVRHGDPSKFVTVPYGIDLAQIDHYRTSVDRADLRTRLRLHADARMLLCVGTFERRKSQSLLLAAFAQVARRHPNATLVCVGDTGSEYSVALRAMRDRHRELASRIRLEPVTPDIYDWYHAADVLVCASDVESLPRSALEAMAFGLPVVATSIFGFPELIEPGVNGDLFAAADLAQLVKALERTLQYDAGELARLAAAARATVEQRYQAHMYATRYNAMLRAVVQPHALAEGIHDTRSHVDR